MDRGNEDALAPCPDANLMPELSSAVASGESIPSSKEEDGDHAQTSIPTSESSREQASSNRDMGSQESTRHHSINIHDLSFILHPAHEVSSPETNASPKTTSGRPEHQKAPMLIRASHALGVASDALEKM